MQRFRLSWRLTQALQGATGVSGLRPSFRFVVQDVAQETFDGCCNLSLIGLEREMTSVVKMYFGVWEIAFVRPRSRGREERVVTAPNGQ